jgi:hypothetical protein
MPSTINATPTSSGLISSADSSGVLALQTGGTTAVTIDGSQNVGIGTASPTVKLSVIAGADGNVGLFRGGSNRQVQIGTTATAGYINTDNGSAGFEIRTQDVARMYVDNSGNVGIGTNDTANAFITLTRQDATLRLNPVTGTATIQSVQTGINFRDLIIASNQTIFQTNAAERMRIDSGGNLLVGTTSANIETGGEGTRIARGSSWVTTTGTTNAVTPMGLYSSGASAYRFYVGAGGTIFATSTTITSLSDQRLKENIIDLDDGLDAVMALKPRKFDWKAGKGKDIKADRGFIAQEFETVFPDMIEESKDPAPEGEEPYKAVNANLIPTLVKAIQEQQTIINNLTTRLNALEGK